MARTLTLVLGGARSGKSRCAEAIVTAAPSPWRYIATAEARDGEMTERIAAHRARRAAGWTTVEAPRDLAEAIAATPPGEPVLVDCVTLWLSNHLIGESDLEAEMAALHAALHARQGPVCVVSNEVGLGIVPENALARRFRDAAGDLNQRLAAAADRVIFVAAGLELQLK